MPSTGTLQVHAFTSNARIPLQNVASSVTAPDGTLIAMRLTDRSGEIEPIELPVPDRAAGLTPNTGEKPFATVDLHARARGYEQITARSIQIFPDTVTDQDMEMVPLSELPSAWDKTEIFSTPPQNL